MLQEKVKILLELVIIRKQHTKTIITNHQRRSLFFFVLVRLTLQLEMVQSFALRITLVFVHPASYVVPSL